MTSLSQSHSLAFSPTTISNSGENLAIAGDKTLCDVLARELAVLAVHDFKLEARVVRWQKQGLKATGSIEVSLSQECIATLEPVKETISVNFDRRFMPADHLVRKYERMEEGNLIIEPDENDEPDEMLPSGIDLWEAVLEEVNLALDPFPRSPDVQQENEPQTTPVEQNGDENTTYRPFADLNALINEKNSKN